MGVGAGLYMYVVVVQKFTFAISSPDEFLSVLVRKRSLLELKGKLYMFCEELLPGIWKFCTWYRCNWNEHDQIDVSFFERPEEKAQSSENHWDWNQQIWWWLRWFRHVERKDDTDQIKLRTVDGIRRSCCLWKTLRDCVNKDLRNIGMHSSVG